MKIISIVFLILFSTITSCSQKSIQYFADITDVDIPASAKVLRDEYRKMGSGHSQVLELKLELDATSKLLRAIINSHYFKQIDTITDPISQQPLIQYGKYKGLWYKQKNGYAFYGTTLNDRDVVTATFDSVGRKATFGIFAD